MAQGNGSEVEEHGSDRGRGGEWDGLEKKALPPVIMHRKAKHAVIVMLLKEFLTREQLSGSSWRDSTTPATRILGKRMTLLKGLDAVTLSAVARSSHVG